MNFNFNLWYFSTSSSSLLCFLLETSSKDDLIYVNCDVRTGIAATSLSKDHRAVLPRLRRLLGRWSRLRPRDEQFGEQFEGDQADV